MLSKLLGESSDLSEYLRGLLSKLGSDVCRDFSRWVWWRIGHEAGSVNQRCWAIS